MHCSLSPDQHLAEDLICLAQRKGYTKIFVKVPESVLDRFSRAGFKVEALIPGFYSTGESTVFMAFYLDTMRCIESDEEMLEQNLKTVFTKKKDRPLPSLDHGYVIRKCTKADLVSVAELYQRVFVSYPFPIHDPDYLSNTMQSNVEYFCIEANGDIVAVSAAEIDKKNMSAEMTDFATSPGWRSQNFAQHLLALMETKMREKNIKTAYAIARSLSVGINITFHKSGYHYAGRLKNNTNISGRIESMNVWYKKLKN